MSVLALRLVPLGCKMAITTTFKSKDEENMCLLLKTFTECFSLYLIGQNQIAIRIPRAE